MKKYITAKLVQAEPEKMWWTEEGGRYFIHYGVDVPENALRVTDGYKTIDSRGRYGWVEKEEFEAEYREVSE